MKRTNYSTAKKPSRAPILRAIAGRERQIADQPTNGVALAHLEKLKAKLAAC